MNEKKAKLVRKLARRVALLQMWPRVAYVQHPTSGVVSLHPNSYKAVYKAMKKQYMRMGA